MYSSYVYLVIFLRLIHVFVCMYVCMFVHVHIVCMCVRVSWTSRLQGIPCALNGLNMRFKYSTFFVVIQSISLYSSDFIGVLLMAQSHLLSVPPAPVSESPCTSAAVDKTHVSPRYTSRNPVQ